MKPASPAKVVAAARGWIGTPYHDQASVRGAGCDCLGLVRGIWREVIGPEPLALPAYSRDWGETGAREVLLEAMRKVAIEAPRDLRSAGVVLLFRMRRTGLAKHLGVMTGPDSFIHAYDRLGVIEQPLSPAWAARVAFAFQFPRKGR